MKADAPILYPSVTSIPKANESPDSGPKAKEVGDGFQKIFGQELGRLGPKPDLSQVRQPLKISAHAAERLQSRKINFDPQTMAKINDAVQKAEAKGLEDTLILTQDAALIVSVKNRTVVTAMDRHSLNGNVFTNIDGAVIL